MFGVLVSVLAVVHEKIEQLSTTRNNMQQGMQHATCNIQQCCVRQYQAGVYVVTQSTLTANSHYKNSYTSKNILGLIQFPCYVLENALPGWFKILSFKIIRIQTFLSRFFGIAYCWLHLFLLTELEESIIFSTSCLEGFQRSHGACRRGTLSKATLMIVLFNKLPAINSSLPLSRHWRGWWRGRGRFGIRGWWRGNHSLHHTWHHTWSKGWWQKLWGKLPNRELHFRTRKNTKHSWRIQRRQHIKFHSGWGRWRGWRWSYWPSNCCWCYWFNCTWVFFRRIDWSRGRLLRWRMTMSVMRRRWLMAWGSVMRWRMRFPGGVWIGVGRGVGHLWSRRVKRVQRFNSMAWAFVRRWVGMLNGCRRWRIRWLWGRPRLSMRWGMRSLWVRMRRLVFLCRLRFIMMMVSMFASWR